MLENRELSGCCCAGRRGDGPDHPAHGFFVERYRKTRAGIEAFIAQEQASGRTIDAVPARRLAAVAPSTSVRA